jgi:hypothetical protein
MTDLSSPSGRRARRETTVRVFWHSRDLVEDQVAPARYGYDVTYVLVWRPQLGYWRLRLLGVLFAYLLPSRPEQVVTYARWVG